MAVCGFVSFDRRRARQRVTVLICEDIRFIYQVSIRVEYDKSDATERG